MSSKIIIFGDSFADPASGGKYESEEDENFMAWYELLSKKYQIKNFGKAGTGPHYSFKKYYSFITNKRNQFRDYICIFFLSGEDRINFYGAPKVSNNINWDFVEKKSSWSVAENLEKEEKFYENFKSEIDFFYLTNHDELQWSNIKNLGFLHMNSLLLNMKTIVFCTFGLKILRQESYCDFTELKNNNFYLFPYDLGKITENEFIDTDENYGRDFVDHRRNHMSSVNHKIFYENIEKIIKNDYRLLPFAKNIDYIKNFGELRDTKLGKFIYE
tara:strand:- start:1895 stop:2710 length:816 start_codon:yes stop_codon:yes gene_type:complete